MIILGIDPGTATTGYGVIEMVGNTPRYVACGVIETAAGLDPWVRLHTIRQDLDELIEKYKPTMAGVEKLYFATNVTTAMSVAQARGVILEKLFEGGVQIREFTPLEVKNTVTGYGQADKKQMQACVKMQLGLDKVPKPDDAADALGIAICAGLGLKFGML